MIDNETMILTQWQTCVEMANAVSLRRDTMNNLFVTLNIAIVAATAIMWDIKSITVTIGGIALCIVWIIFIHNFKLLNEAKFKVILELESKLPESPFCEEWQILKSKKEYRDGTKLESILPSTFLLIYVVVIIAIIIMKMEGAPNV